MKTLNDCKNIVAVKNGFGPNFDEDSDAWKGIDDKKKLLMVDELARLYAKEVAQDALNRAFDNADIDHEQNNDDVWGHYVIKESITETEILLP